MIPTVLLAGIAAGAVARLRVGIVVGVVLSLAWGIIVAVGDVGVSTFVGGSCLSAANFAVGSALGGVIHLISNRARLASR